MNKGVLTALIIAVLVALGAGAFMVMNKNTASPPSSETSIQTDLAQEKKSLRDLMVTANNQQCTFTDTQSTSSGTVYVSNGKVRGDFSSVTAGTSVNAHMISDGSDVYLWMDGETQGFKTSIDATESLATEANSSVDLDKAIDYDCSNWTVNNSVFQVPTTVKFQDMSALMAPQGSGSTDTKAMQCQACNSLPGDGAAQCKTTLGCN